MRRINYKSLSTREQRLSAAATLTDGRVVIPFFIPPELRLSASFVFSAGNPYQARPIYNYSGDSDRVLSFTGRVVSPCPTEQSVSPWLNALESSEPSSFWTLRVGEQLWERLLLTDWFFQPREGHTVPNTGEPTDVEIRLEFLRA
jgi:hypothetical protein